MNLTTIKPEYRLSDLSYPEEIRAQIFELLEDGNYEMALRENGIPIRKKILLHGPPGCGKTALAHALASELKIPVVLVPISETIGSHLGETEKNVANAFAFAGNNKCALVLDEFDAIGSARSEGQSGASKSMNNAVNVILTDLERLKPLGLVIACTNFFHQLDHAIIRRFDLVLEIPRPTPEILHSIAHKIIQGRFSIDLDEIVSCSSTPAAVVRCSYDRLRKAVIRQEQERLPVNPKDEVDKIIRRIREPEQTSIPFPETAQA